MRRVRAALCVCVCALLSGSLGVQNVQTQVRRVLELCASAERGLRSADNAAIVAAIKDIEISTAQEPALNLNLLGAKQASLSGCWELLWTTEKETLFFAKNGMFGRSCVGIEQTIGDDAILNSILFQDSTSFAVEGSLRSEGARSFFKFRKAVLSIPPLPALTLPPVGAGWFDTVYLDRTHRISADIRGDYLVCRRK